jgi:hypothetical protein
VGEAAMMPKRQKFGNKSFLSAYVLNVESACLSRILDDESATISKRRSIELVSKDVKTK